MRYELCYLVGESKEPNLQKIKEEVSAIVSKEGGKWLEPQVEEKRKMAYKVGKEVRGIYIAQQFEIVRDEEKEDAEKNNSLDNISKKLNLYNNILRFIVIKAEDVPELKVREIKEPVKKDFKKPVYVKRSEVISPKASIEKPVSKEKEESSDTKKDVTEEKKKTEEAESEKEKTEKKGKSIDEKIEEILNI